jgi:hypothetical protein
MWLCKNKPYRQTLIENSKMKTINRKEYNQAWELRDIQDTITKWLNRDDRFPVQQDYHRTNILNQTGMIRYKVNMTSTDRFGNKITIFYFLDDPLEFKQELFNMIKIEDKLKDFDIEMNENLQEGEIVINAPSEIFDPVLDEDLKIKETFQKMTNETKLNEKNRKHLNMLEKFSFYVYIVTSIIASIILYVLWSFYNELLDQMVILYSKANAMDVVSKVEFHHLTLLFPFVTISACIIVSVVLTCFGFPISLVYRKCIDFLKQKAK